VHAVAEAEPTTIVYVGPAGDQFRADMGATSNRLRGTCDRIVDLAGRLLREADRVEAERLAAARADTIYYD
jgi:hypothetical protein